jgi:NAD(P)-dependent dehydrogenase (short-subunit alcohol dehydrogenase family)
VCSRRSWSRARPGAGAPERGRRLNRKRLEQLFGLAGRVALITGGTRGIGLAVAEGLAGAGATVVVASRKPEACESAEERLRAAGSEALAVPTHLGQPDQLAALVARAVERFGGIDIVVNNAANALAQPIGGITTEAWAKSFDVNLRGPVLLVQEALPHLERSDHAAVLNVISAGAFMFSPGISMYAAAKAALLSFTRSMAAELASKGVRVNALAPGSVDTDMLRNNGPAYAERAASACLQRRIASPEEMVGPALFLVSDASSYVTGHVVVADGGLVTP